MSAPAKLSFFAGVPLTSKNGHNIGTIGVVDPTEKPPLATPEVDFLTDTARKCTILLESARERGSHSRWTATQEELDIFLRSRTLHAQSLKEPQITSERKSSKEEEGVNGTKEHEAKRIEPETLSQEPLSAMHDPPVEGSESQKLVEAEIERDHCIAERENKQDARSLTSSRGKDDERGLPKGETIYRKVFRRGASACALLSRLTGFCSSTVLLASMEKHSLLPSQSRSLNVRSYVRKLIPISLHQQKQQAIDIVAWTRSTVPILPIRPVHIAGPARAPST